MHRHKEPLQATHLAVSGAKQPCASQQPPKAHGGQRAGSARHQSRIIHWSSMWQPAGRWIAWPGKCTSIVPPADLGCPSTSPLDDRSVRPITQSAEPRHTRSANSWSNMLRQRAVRHQQRAASREQVQHYKQRLSAELAEAQQRAAASAEQQRLEEVSRWVAEAAAQRERQRLAQLTAARACAAQQAKREAKARWLQAAEAAAQERHVAALAAKRQAVEQLATEVSRGVCS